jgi:sn-glycerol 3-phosphate transport system substrate-binding protein
MSRDFPQLKPPRCAAFLLTTIASWWLSAHFARAQVFAPAPDIAVEEVEAKTEPSADDEETTRIRIWVGTRVIAEEFAYQIKKFNDTQDEIVVEPRVFSGYNDTFQELLKALEKNEVPDAAIIEVHSIAALAAEKKILPLDDLIKRDKGFQPDDLLAGMLTNLRYEKELVALPVNRSTPVLYYNKDLFAAAGLDPEKPPATWQEVQQIAPALTSIEKGRFGFLAPSFPWIFQALVWSSGGKLVDGKHATFAEPAAKPLQIWADMVHRDKSAKFGGRQSATSEFCGGRVAMALESTAMLHLYTTSSNFDVGTAALPHFAGFEPAVPMGGGAAVIPASLSDKRREAVWKFLTWFIATKQAAAWSRATGYIPVRESSRALLESKEFYVDNPGYEVAIKQLDVARESPQLPKWPEAWQVIGTAMTSIIRDDAPPRETLKGAEEKVDSLLFARESDPH